MCMCNGEGFEELRMFVCIAFTIWLEEYPANIAIVLELTSYYIDIHQCWNPTEINNPTFYRLFGLFLFGCYFRHAFRGLRHFGI